MKTIAKLTLLLLLAPLALAAAGSGREVDLQESFEFQGQRYGFFAAFSPYKADLVMKGARSRNLSAGLAGENVLLGPRGGLTHFYVFWIYCRDGARKLAYFDQRLDRSRVLPLSGFTFFSLPEIIEEDGVLRGLVFLGNRYGNDDIFHYDLASRRLTALTRTPFSEKGFAMKAAGSGYEIETRSLWKTFRYRFEPRDLRCELLEERSLARPRRLAASPVDPSLYYNTYIGFGDSITRSQWEGQEWPELGYLAQMGQILAETYGPTLSINLGIGGTRTYEGALRVEDDLDAHPAFYFILFYGVNDVIHSDTFSLESSLENLEFMIDAAQARGMRVITTTLTPRKDSFAYFKFYWNNLHALSDGIVQLAQRKNAVCVDTLSAFMNTDPPDGWKTLLESVNPPLAKGNHPNEKGHRVIASLFAPALAAFAPLPPGNLRVLNPSAGVNRKALWDANYESDFSHYQIEFGFQPGALEYSLTTPASFYSFPLLPFLPQLWFRLRTVDRTGHASPFVGLDDGAAASVPAARRKD